MEPLNSDESSLPGEEASPLQVELVFRNDLPNLSRSGLPIPSGSSLPPASRDTDLSTVLLHFLPPSEKWCIAWENYSGLPWGSCHAKQCSFSSGPTLPLYFAFSPLARLKSQQATKREVKSMICEICYIPKELFEFSNLYRQKFGDRCGNGGKLSGVTVELTRIRLNL